jgi:hypothetical protein
VSIPANTDSFLGDFDTIPEPLQNRKWVWKAYQISGTAGHEAGQTTPKTHSQTPSPLQPGESTGDT